MHEIIGSEEIGIDEDQDDEDEDEMDYSIWRDCGPDEEVEVADEVARSCSSESLVPLLRSHLLFTKPSQPPSPSIVSKIDFSDHAVLQLLKYAADCHQPDSCCRNFHAMTRNAIIVSSVDVIKFWISRVSDSVSTMTIGNHHPVASQNGTQFVSQSFISGEQISLSLDACSNRLSLFHCDLVRHNGSDHFDLNGGNSYPALIFELLLDTFLGIAIGESVDCAMNFRQRDKEVILFHVAKGSCSCTDSHSVQAMQSFFLGRIAFFSIDHMCVTTTIDLSSLDFSKRDSLLPNELLNYDNKDIVDGFRFICPKGILTFWSRRENENHFPENFLSLFCEFDERKQCNRSKNMFTRNESEFHSHLHWPSYQQHATTLGLSPVAVVHFVLHSIARFHVQCRNCNSNSSCPQAHQDLDSLLLRGKLAIKSVSTISDVGLLLKLGANLLSNQESSTSCSVRCRPEVFDYTSPIRWSMEQLVVALLLHTSSQFILPRISSIVGSHPESSLLSETYFNVICLATLEIPATEIETGNCSARETKTKTSLGTDSTETSCEGIPEVVHSIIAQLDSITLNHLSVFKDDQIHEQLEFSDSASDLSQSFLQLCRIQHDLIDTRAIRAVINQLFLRDGFVSPLHWTQLLVLCMENGQFLCMKHCLVAWRDEQNRMQIANKSCTSCTTGDADTTRIAVILIAIASVELDELTKHLRLINNGLFKENMDSWGRTVVASVECTLVRLLNELSDVNYFTSTTTLGGCRSIEIQESLIPVTAVVYKGLSLIIDIAGSITAVGSTAHLLAKCDHGMIARDVLQFLLLSGDSFSRFPALVQLSVLEVTFTIQLVDGDLSNIRGLPFPSSWLFSLVN